MPAFIHNTIHSGLGASGVCRAVPYYRGEEDGETTCTSEESGDSRDTRLHVGALLRQDWYTYGREDGESFTHNKIS